MGKKDIWFSSTSPIPPEGEWFPGTLRGVTTAEMLGEFFVMQKIWEKLNGSIELYIHSADHIVSFDEAEKFIEQQNSYQK